MGAISSCCRGISDIGLVFVSSTDMFLGSDRSRDGLYEPALADSEREAVADLLQYLENVRAVYARREKTSL